MSGQAAVIRGSPKNPMLWLVNVDDAGIASLVDTAKRYKEHAPCRPDAILWPSELHVTLWYKGKPKPGDRQVAAAGADPYLTAHGTLVDLDVRFILYSGTHIVAAVSFVGANGGRISALCQNQYAHVTLWTAPTSRPMDSQNGVANMVRATGPVEEYWHNLPAGVPVVRKSIGIAIPTPGLRVSGRIGAR